MAFNALTDVIVEDCFEPCQQVLAGDEDGLLINRPVGIAVDMASPAGYVKVQPHPRVLRL